MWSSCCALILYIGNTRHEADRYRTRHQVEAGCRGCICMVLTEALTIGVDTIEELAKRKD